MPQPYFVPVSLNVSRSTHSRGVCGSSFVVRFSPFTITFVGVTFTSPVSISESKPIANPWRHVAHPRGAMDRLLPEWPVKHVDIVCVHGKMTVHLPVELEDRSTSFVTRLSRVAGDQQIPGNSVQSVVNVLAPIKSPSRR